MSNIKRNKVNGIAASAGVAALALFAAWQFYLFASFRNEGGAFDSHGGTSHLWFAIAAALVACTLGFLAFSVLVGYDEKNEMHINSQE